MSENTERDVWVLDQKINLRGVHFDLESIDCAADIAEQAKLKLDRDVRELTDGELNSTNSRAQVFEWALERFGVKLESYAKDAVERMVQDESLPQLLRDVLKVRLEASKTSVAKYSKLLDIVDKNDHRARGLLQYHAASTGRWGGRMFQPQNLTRGSLSDPNTCIEMFKHRDAGLIDMCYDSTMEALSSCVRGMICSPPEKDLYVADFSAIEARVLAWLAEQHDITEAFATHGKIYELAAANIFNIKLEDVSKYQRTIGKTAVLALGYGGGVQAFKNLAGEDCCGLSEEEVDDVKVKWRKSNSKIVGYWRDLEQAAKSAVQNKGAVYQVGNVAFKMRGRVLQCKLPSGRKLTYWYPKIKKSNRNLVAAKEAIEHIKEHCGDVKEAAGYEFRIVNGDIVCTALDSNLQVVRDFYTDVDELVQRLDLWQPMALHYKTVVLGGKFAYTHTYGGKLAENITQAVARDLMAYAMLQIDKAGFDIVLTVHDEIVAEAKGRSIQEFEELMCSLPEWATFNNVKIPLNAEGYIAKRYKK